MLCHELGELEYGISHELFQDSESIAAVRVRVNMDSESNGMREEVLYLDVLENLHQNGGVRLGFE